MGQITIPEMNIDANAYNWLLEQTKSKVGASFSRESFDECLLVSQALQLNPLKKQIYFLPYKGKLQPLTSIEGYRAIAHRTGLLAGTERKPIYNAKGELIGAECTVKRLIKDGRIAEFKTQIKRVEFDTRKNLWLTHPESMCLKVAEAHALRMAFPEHLDGVYTHEELVDIDTEEPVRPTQPSKPATQQSKARAEAAQISKGIRKLEDEIKWFQPDFSVATKFPTDYTQIKDLFTKAKKSNDDADWSAYNNTATLMLRGLEQELQELRNDNKS